MHEHDWEEIHAIGGYENIRFCWTCNEVSALPAEGVSDEEFEAYRQTILESVS